jgi:Tfp pilus assembly protein PilV
MRVKKLKVLNQAGMTLLELLTVVGLTTVIAAGVAGMNHFALQSAKQLDSTSMALGLKNTFITQIENTVAWQKTLENNPEMSCLLTQTECLNTPPQAFNLYNEKGQLAYDAKSPTAGFTATRRNCNDFPNKATSCVYRFDLTWKPLCPVTGPCTNPLVMVSADLQLDDPGSLNGSSVMQDKNYSLQVFKSYAKNSMEANCVAVGGVYDAVTKTCKAKLSDQRCGPGQVVAGVEGNGNIICAPLFKAKCDANEVLTGVGPTGLPICTDKVAQFSPTPPANPATKPTAVTGPASTLPASATPATACALSFGGRVVDSKATLDKDFDYLAGNITYSGPLKTSNVRGDAGNINLGSVIEVPKIQGVAGDIWINATWIGSISGVAGTLCINAQTIGAIESGAGDSELFANSIESISSEAGEVRIHKAVVKSFTKSAGNICLLDGATVLDVSGVAGKVVYSCN